ncbi:MAG: LysR family transcriptional regulator [Aquabacterium sp.]|nr:MAG: LysR family transcriptional regulator [Aquabacterium sp.]
MRVSRSGRVDRRIVARRASVRRETFSCRPCRAGMPMSNDPRRLLQSLTLDSLRGFESTARLGSFTAAAQELSLTQSAVSKQVRLLEDTLGRALFVRGARALVLTDEGRQLHEAAREVLLRLEQAVRLVTQPERAVVSLTAPPSFSSLWLAPRLAALRALDPQVDIRLDASEDHLALERDGFDLAVRLSPPERAAGGWTLLCRERLFLVAVPGLAARIREPADLAGVPLLVFDHAISREGGLSWEHWQQLLGWTAPAAQPRFRFSQYEHALKAAAEGAGVAIGRAPQVDAWLEEGRLQPVLGRFEAQGAGCYLVWSGPARARPQVQRVAQWLQQALRHSSTA